MAKRYQLNAKVIQERKIELDHLLNQRQIGGDINASRTQILEDLIRREYERLFTDKQAQQDPEDDMPLPAAQHREEEQHLLPGYSEGADVQTQA